MQGIWVILLTTALLLSSVTPMKVSVMTVTASIMVSLQMYWMMESIFPSASTVISFSSGMMILFCYCALMTSFESKNQKKIMIMATTVMIMATLMTSSENQESTNSSKSKTSLMVTSPFIMTAMAVVIITMVAVNKTTFNPTKPLASSY